jgi:tetratricopeptide (TPR) repeat protein
MRTTRACVLAIALAGAMPARGEPALEQVLTACRALVDKAEAEEGLRRCTEALDLSRKLGERRAEGRALHAAGAAHFYLGEYEEALEDYQQALAALRAVQDVSDAAEVLDDMGILATNQGRYQGLAAFGPPYAHPYYWAPFVLTGDIR